MLRLDPRERIEADHASDEDLLDLDPEFDDADDTKARRAARLWENNPVIRAFIRSLGANSWRTEAALRTEFGFDVEQSWLLSLMAWGE